MANEVASTIVQLSWIPEQHDYSIVVKPNAVRFDSNNKPTVSTISANVFRDVDGERSALPVNSASGAKYWLLLVKTSAAGTTRTPCSSVNTLLLADATDAGFELVAKDDVKVSGSTYTYSDADIITSESIAITHDGTQGAKNVNAFCRNDSRPDAPTGGTYDKPWPTTTGWSDEPPIGDKPLWMSTATFEVGSITSPKWSTPVSVADDADIEFIFTKNDPPVSADKIDKTHPHPDNDADNGDGWGKNPDGAVYMAVAKKSGGAWQEWNVMRIKGEAAISLLVTPTNIVAHNGVLPLTVVDVKIFDGGEHKADGLGPISTTAAGVQNTETGVTWNYYNAGNVYGYRLFGVLKKDVVFNSYVTYKGVNYPFTLQLTRNDDGEDAVDYRLIVNPDQLQYDLNSSKYITNTVTVGVKKVDGNNITQVAWSALGGLGLSAMYRFLKTDGSYSLWSSVLNGTISCGTTLYTRVEFSLRKDNVEIDSATVGIGQFGKNGTDGKNGVYVPPMMLWTDYPDEYPFQAGNVEAGDDHLDYVGVLESDGRVTLYYCVENNLKKDGFNPATDNNKKKAKGYHWFASDAGTYKFLATELLWAAIGQIDFFNSQVIRIGNQSGMLGYFGVPTGTTHGGAIFYSGADNPTQATFVVYADGSFTATNADIEGRITVSTLDLKVSTAGDGAIPNGSLCFDINSIKLPVLPNGVVRSIKVYNPIRTRNYPGNLSLVPENTTVKISTDGSFDTVTNGTKTIAEYGCNGNVYLELLGINLNGTTIWTVNILSSH